MGLETPLRLAPEMPLIAEPQTNCLDFVRFRIALKQHRAVCDDNIRQRLASLTRPSDQCPKFADNLKRAQQSRLRNLKTCINVLNQRLDSSDKIISPNSTEKQGTSLDVEILRKEVR
jgi:hypothetical protein